MEELFGEFNACSFVVGFEFVSVQGAGDAESSSGAVVRSGDFSSGGVVAQVGICSDGDTEDGVDLDLKVIAFSKIDY